MDAQVGSAVKPKPRLLNTKEAADYLGVRPNTLEVWRVCHRYDLPFIRVGRLVKYREADLDEFLAARTVGAGT